MKNDIIAIILPHSLASNESNFELNNELITRVSVQGVTNDIMLGIAVARSDI